MEVNLASYDRRIIEKGGQYLKGATNGRPVWHWSAYEAWWDERNGGRYVGKVARKTGGTVRVFNPITGTIRKEGAEV